MANSRSICRAVLDCNVLVAAHRSADPDSPDRELIERWQANEITFLFSRDTLHEYAEKLRRFINDVPSRSVDWDACRAADNMISTPRIGSRGAVKATLLFTTGRLARVRC